MLLGVDVGDTVTLTETFVRLTGEEGDGIASVQMLPNEADEEAEAIHDLVRGRYEFAGRRKRPPMPWPAASWTAERCFFWSICPSAYLPWRGQLLRPALDRLHLISPGRFEGFRIVWMLFVLSHEPIVLQELRPRVSVYRLGLILWKLAQLVVLVALDLLVVLAPQTVLQQLCPDQMPLGGDAQLL